MQIAEVDYLGITRLIRCAIVQDMNKKVARGFALLTPERRREIAQLGGKKIAKLGTGHRFTSAEASKAGKMGGRGNKKNA